MNTIGVEIVVLPSCTPPSPPSQPFAGKRADERITHPTFDDVDRGAVGDDEDGNVPEVGVSRQKRGALLEREAGRFLHVSGAALKGTANRGQRMEESVANRKVVGKGSSNRQGKATISQSNTNNKSSSSSNNNKPSTINSDSSACSAIRARSSCVHCYNCTATQPQTAAAYLHTTPQPAHLLASTQSGSVMTFSCIHR